MDENRARDDSTYRSHYALDERTSQDNHQVFTLIKMKLGGVTYGGCFGKDSPSACPLAGNEKCIGMAEIKALWECAWSQFESMSYEFRWSSVSAAGSVAWVATDITGHAKVGGQEMTLAQPTPGLEWIRWCSELWKLTCLY